MNEIIVEATGLPLQFPNPAEEAYARAQEFRQLPPKERLAYFMCGSNPGQGCRGGARLSRSTARRGYTGSS